MSYMSGGNWGLCQRCGFKVRANKLKKEWTGLLVCKQCYEPRHPQDFIKLVRDNISPEIISPEPYPTYISVTYSDTQTDIPQGTFTNYIENYLVDEEGNYMVTSTGDYLVVY